METTFCLRKVATAALSCSSLVTMSPPGRVALARRGRLAQAAAECTRDVRVVGAGWAAGVRG